MTSWTKTAVFLGICLLAGTVSGFAQEAGGSYGGYMVSWILKPVSARTWWDEVHGWLEQHVGAGPTPAD